MSAHTWSTAESSGTNASSQSSEARGRRSKVWEHYEQKLVEVDGVLRAVCKYCGLKLSTKSGTSSLLTHIADHCPAIDDAIRKRFVAKVRKQPSENFIFDPKLSRECMIDYVMHAEIAFNKVEDPYYKPWMKTLQPTLKCLGRQTIRNDCLKKYEKLKETLLDELRNLDSHVCLTTDLWTSVQNLGYIAITAHYIDAEFNLKKKVIGFRDVKYPHTGWAIEEALVKCLTEWGIREKVFTLTVDNASNNTSACEELIANHKHVLMFEGAHLQVRCCAHILNILVQDGLKIISGAVKKIRELLKHMDSSGSRIQDFNEIATRNGLPSKRGIELDIPNRWNSTFEMIGEALQYKGVLNSYANQHREIAPSEEEWLTAEAIYGFLEAFEEATLNVSADRKPTSHRFLALVLYIRHALNNPVWQTSPVLREAASSMKLKFEKYWEPDPDGFHLPNPRTKRKKYDFNVAIIIATLLDPRRKEDYLQFFYEKVCSNVDHVHMFVNSAIQWMRKYFVEYEQRVRSCTEIVPCSNFSSNLVGSPVLGKRQLEAEFADFKSRRRTTRAPKSEFDIYMEEDIVEDSTSFDILSWWKAHAEQFPVLSTMARDFLAIPLSTVSSESAFSCGGRLLGESRSSLAPETLEALVCGKDWLYKPKSVDDTDEDLDSGQDATAPQ